MNKTKAPPQRAWLWTLFWNTKARRFDVEVWSLKRGYCKHGPNIVYAGYTAIRGEA